MLRVVLLLTGYIALYAGIARGAEESVDYAESRYVDLWLRHPVYGDPSFDAFEHWAENPVHRGTREFGWPVNGFLFHDPVGGKWYVFAGEYKTGYGGGSSRCLLYRSDDHRHWENLGPV